MTFLSETLSQFQLYNLETDLHISDNQYLITLTIFFFSYAVFEVCYLRAQEEHCIKCRTGSIQRVSEKTSAFCMVIITDASLGNNDGTPTVIGIYA